MATLRQKMAQFGFESNDDYQYQLRCLLNYQTSGLRCLNIEGSSNRRKTAFANALAMSLNYDHVLFYDFTQQSEPFTTAVLPNHDDEEGQAEQPIGAFDRAVSEACAFSEAEKVVLIVDQLQAADFSEHIRLYQFVSSCQWAYSLATLRANPKNFLLFLISEDPLYHSLQKASFKVWTEDAHTHLKLDPADFALDTDALPMMNTLSELFTALGTTPTHSELQRIIHDVLTVARTEQLLRHSIFGWTEGIDRSALFSEQLDPQVNRAMRAIELFVGLDEIEIDSAQINPSAN